MSGQITTVRDSPMCIMTGSISVVTTFSGSLSGIQNMTGTLSPMRRMEGNLSSVQTMSGSLSVPDVVGRESYTGEYNITPSTQNDIILDTAYKTLSNNINIYKIPYFETSNESGYTVYIGGEL